MRRDKGTGSIHQTPNGSWVGRINLGYVAGKRKVKTIQRKTQSQLIKAMEEWRTAYAQYGGLGDDPKMREWLTVWLTQVDDVRPKTKAGYAAVVKNQMIPRIGEIKINSLSADDIRAMTKSMIDDGLSPTYANNAHVVLRIALKAAQAEKILKGHNVAALIKAPTKARATLKTLRPAEGIAVLKHAADQRLGSLWATYLFTACRRGEALGLETDRVGNLLDLSWQLQRISWRHGCQTRLDSDRVRCGWKRGTDCPDRKIEVPANYDHRHLIGSLYLTRPKSDSGWRVLPLVSPLAEILDRQAELVSNPWGLMWDSEQGNPLDPDRVTEMWFDVLAGAGISKHVRLHDVRHTTVDLLYEAGVPEGTIRDIVGHSAVSMTRSYRTRANLPALEDALSRLSKMLEG